MRRHAAVTASGRNRARASRSRASIGSASPRSSASQTSMLGGRTMARHMRRDARRSADWPRDARGRARWPRGRSPASVVKTTASRRRRLAGGEGGGLYVSWASAWPARASVRQRRTLDVRLGSRRIGRRRSPVSRHGRWRRMNSHASGRAAKATLPWSRTCSSTRERNARDSSTTSASTFAAPVAIAVSG